MLRVLRTPGFRLLLGGQAINAIGNWVSIIAIWGFAAYEFDAGAADLALLFVVLSLPGAVFGPFLGVPIDRFGPRRTLIAANLAGVVSALALTQAGSYGQVILLALPLGLVEALATSSLDALPPRLVPDEDLVSANALLGASQNFAIIAGPVVAAAVNVKWGLAGAFVADAITFAVGALVALPLRIDHEPAERSGTWRELREGLDLVRRDPGLRWTFRVAGATYLLWGFAGIVEPLYARDVLEVSDTTFAMFQTVWGVGLVGTELMLARIGDRVARPHWVAIGMIFAGVGAAVYMGTEWTVVAFIGVFLWGIDSALFFTPTKTLLQRYAPIRAHGRIMSLNQTMEPAASIVMAPVVSTVVVFASIPILTVGAGGLSATAGLLALRSSRSLPPPPKRAVDPTAGTSRDAIALGGAAPGS